MPGLPLGAPERHGATYLSVAVGLPGIGVAHSIFTQIDGYGRAWVTNAGLGGARLVNTRAAILVGKFGGSITVIGPDFKPVAFSPIQSSSFKWPLGLAIDSENNAWVTSYFSSAVIEIRPSGAVAGVYHRDTPPLEPLRRPVRDCLHAN